MSLLNTAEFAIAVCAIWVVYQLRGIHKQLEDVADVLRSLDEELFHVAQEQNPNYGRCGNCDRRAIVRHVVPKDRDKAAANSPDLFYCKPCWWLSDTVELGDEAKHFKDRTTREDIVAATVGPC